MNLHWLQHIAAEGLGSIENWAKARGHSLNGWRLYQRAVLPSARDLDGLIVLGGPMSVHELGRLPWLEDERRLIRHCLQLGKPVLGICLGAQQLAKAIGGEVRRGPVPEIGWFPVSLTHAGQSDPLLQGLPPEFEALHWHSEHITLPTACVHLARSEACSVQAFRVGRRALGLQCHLEMQAEGVKALGEVIPPPPPDLTVQSLSQMRAQTEHFKAAERWMFQLLDNLFAQRG